MLRLERWIALAAIAACGSAQRPSQPRIDPKTLARELHVEINEMAEITHRLRWSCSAMAAELRPLFTRMRRSVATAREAERDRELAQRVVAETRTYADQDRGLAESFAADLASCATDHDVQDVMTTMPTL